MGDIILKPSDNGALSFMSGNTYSSTYTIDAAHNQLIIGPAVMSGTMTVAGNLTVIGDYNITGTQNVTGTFEMR